MTYFVTGATGFIGRFLIGNLLKRKGKIHVLVRKGSLKKFDALIEKLGWDPKDGSCRCRRPDQTQPRHHHGAGRRR
jgi:thioester reductase-like protein